MFHRRAIIVTLGAAAGALIVGHLVIAGPLSPPAGPVASTGPTQMSDALTPLPYTITTPGSYVLTSNLTGVSGQHGIIVATSDVTIDLNGFRISGVSGSNHHGINLNPGSLRCTIRNGTIRAWSFAIFGLDAHHTRVERVTATANVGQGLFLGDHALVSACIAYDNANNGIRAGDGSLVTGCEANGNVSTGIAALVGSLIENCVSTDNGGHGISIARGMVRGCTASANGGSQIHDSTAGESLLIDNHTLP